MGNFDLKIIPPVIRVTPAIPSVWLVCSIGYAVAEFHSTYLFHRN
jgi:hypothetical protein